MYPITRNRAYDKYQDMKNALNNLDKSISRRICPYRNLG